MRIPTITQRYARPISRRTFLLGGLAGVGALMAGCTDSKSTVIDAVPDPGYPDATIFVPPEWLASRIDQEDLRILDCSSLAAYRRGHIPGARHVWWQDTIEVHNPVYGMLVNADGRAELARRAGIEPGMEIVCYDDAGGVYAGRVAWTLRYMGIRATRLLLGGTAAWRGAGFELSRREERGDASEPVPDIFDESIVAHPEDIVSRMDEPGLVLLDTRTEAERRETWHGKLRVGQILSGVWMPRDRLLDERQLPVSASELLTLLEEVIVLDDTAEIIVYGLHATLASLPYYMILALDRFHVRLYDGSWSQWGTDPNLLIAPLDG